MAKSFNQNVTFPFLTKGPSYPLAKCQSVIVVKIRVSVASSNSSMETMFKWRVKRLVMSLRPPPGGPMAVTSSCLKQHKFYFNNIVLGKTTLN